MQTKPKKRLSNYAKLAMVATVLLLIPRRSSRKANKMAHNTTDKVPLQVANGQQINKPNEQKNESR